MENLFTWNAWAVIIPNVLVIAGWAVTHYLNGKSAKQAELRKAGKDLIIQIEECQKLAIVYHTAEKRNIELEHQIVLLLERIDIKTSLLCNELNLLDDFWNVKRAITKDNFQAYCFIPQKAETELIKNIYVQTNEQIKKFYML